MLIFEGPDGGGKSTTIKFVQAAFPEYDVVHSPGPITHLTERKFWNWELCRLENLIFDRCTFFSEYIYGPVLRTVSLISYEEVIEFIMYFQRFPKNMLIYCDIGFGHHPTEDSGEKTELEKQVDENQGTIREEYRALFTRLFTDHQHFPRFKVTSPLDVIDLLEVIRGLKE